MFDTPGIGDTKSRNQDLDNVGEILNAFTSMPETVDLIYAAIIFWKASENRDYNNF